MNRIDHTTHDHVNTKVARAACRRTMTLETIAGDALEAARVDFNDDALRYLNRALSNQLALELNQLPASTSSVRGQVTRNIKDARKAISPSDRTAHLDHVTKAFRDANNETPEATDAAIATIRVRVIG